MLVSARSLVTPRRFDIAVKWRYFRHLLTGGDADSERVYKWHLQARKAANAKVNLGMDGKANTDQYVEDSRNLLVSMAINGFNPEYPIPIDPDGELLGGAHRLACALALGIDAVPVERREQKVWAPAWDMNHFYHNDASAEDMQRIATDWKQIANAS